MSARRDRRRREAQSNYIRDLTLVAGSREADGRFAARIAADQATADAGQAAEWVTYETRHGTPILAASRINPSARPPSRQPAPRSSRPRAWLHSAGHSGTGHRSGHDTPGQTGMTTTPT